MNTKIFKCHHCNNVIISTDAGDSEFSCCMHLLNPEDEKVCEGRHDFDIEVSDGEYYVKSAHPMDKDHFILAFIYKTDDKLSYVRLFSEGACDARFKMMGHGKIYMLCNQHDLFYKEV